MPEYDGHLDQTVFRRTFPTWGRLEDHLRQLAEPGFPADRAIRQLILGDLLGDLNRGGDDWHLTGSLTLPARAEAWPTDAGAALGDIDPVYTMARTANDMDGYNAALLGLPEDEYVSRTVASVLAVAPERRNVLDGAPGLGGLVRRAVRSVDVTGSGHVVFTIDVQPVDDGRGPLDVRPAGPVYTVEFDVKMPSMIQRSSDDERALRSMVGVELPGLRPITPLMRPTADLVADKMAALACRPGVGDGIIAPRFKDVVDLYYLVQACPMDGDLVRKALAENWHWAAAGLTGPANPYRFYGQSPVPEGEAEILWENGVRQLRERIPQLEGYPDFDTMLKTINTFAGGIADPANASWDPRLGRWQRSVRNEVSTAMSHGLVATGAAEVAAQPAVAMQKHLFVFDVDQTLSKYDTLQKLAERAGLGDEVEAAYDPDYETSIRRKAAVLEGVDASLLDEVAAGIQLSPGVEKLMHDLREAGHEVAIASGGFDAIVGPLAERLGVKLFAASELGIEERQAERGAASDEPVVQLTGEVVGKLVDTQAKADKMREWRIALDIPQERTVAVGDGSNDVGMFREAGLAVGFNPSAAARADAHTVILHDMGYINRLIHLPLPEHLATPDATPVRALAGSATAGEALSPGSRTGARRSGAERAT